MFPTVKVPELTVTVREAFIVTLPVPIFRSRVPAKVKSPFQFWVLLLVRVMAAALVLSRVPPAMVTVPIPVAEPPTPTPVPIPVSSSSTAYGLSLIFG